MAATHYHTKTAEMDAKIHNGATLTDITTLVGDGTIQIGALRITKAGSTVVVNYGEHFAVDDNTGALSKITAADLAANWESNA